MPLDFVGWLAKNGENEFSPSLSPYAEGLPLLFASQSRALAYNAHSFGSNKPTAVQAHIVLSAELQQLRDELQKLRRENQRLTKVHTGYERRFQRFREAMPQRSEVERLSTNVQLLVRAMCDLTKYYRSQFPKHEHPLVSSFMRAAEAELGITYQSALKASSCQPSAPSSGLPLLPAPSSSTSSSSSA